jgi:hypothetical protein
MTKIAELSLEAEILEADAWENFKRPLVAFKLRNDSKRCEKRRKELVEWVYKKAFLKAVEGQDSCVSVPEGLSDEEAEDVRSELLHKLTKVYAPSIKYSDYIEDRCKSYDV